VIRIPSRERADHLRELGEREVLVIDGYERLLGVAFRVALDDAAEDVASGHPLMAVPRTCLRMPDGNLDGDVLVLLRQLFTRVDSVVPVSEISSSVMVASFSRHPEVRRGDLRSAYVMIASSPSRVILISSGEARWGRREGHG